MDGAVARFILAKVMRALDTSLALFGGEMHTRSLLAGVIEFHTIILLNETLWQALVRQGEKEHRRPKRRGHGSKMGRVAARFVLTNVTRQLHISPKLHDGVNHTHLGTV